MFNNESRLHDNKLLNRIAQRDLRALEQFYDRHAEIVYGLILYIVQEETLADELLQETFLQVWSQAETIEGERNAALWLYQLARRRCLDALRWSLRNQKQQMALIERIHEQVRAIGTENAFGRNKDDKELSVVFDFTDARSGTERESMLQMLYNIPEDQRVCLALAFFAGMTDQEIARHLNASSNWVKSLITDGLQRLNHISLTQTQKSKESV